MELHCIRIALIVCSLQRNVTDVWRLCLGIPGHYAWCLFTFVVEHIIESWQLVVAAYASNSSPVMWGYILHRTLDVPVVMVTGLYSRATLILRATSRAYYLRILEGMKERPYSVT